MKEPDRKPRKKKLYKKPQIKSSPFYERKALACGKTEAQPGNIDCGEGFFS